jgi:hypothetical protein
MLRMFGRFPATGHPHLWPIRDVVGVSGRTVVVRDRPGGGSLATLLLHRGRLSAGEVVTVVGPLASALAFLHGERIVHTAITPERILFDLDGRPSLAGVGIDDVLGAGSFDRVASDLLDPSVAAGSEPSGATDVFMLARCGLAALGGGPAAAPAALLDALTRGTRPDPAARSTASELAAAVRAACPAEAVRLLVPDPERHPGPEPPSALSIPPEWLAPERRVPPYLSVPPESPTAAASPNRSVPEELAGFDRLPPPDRSTSVGSPRPGSVAPDASRLGRSERAGSGASGFADDVAPSVLAAPSSDASRGVPAAVGGDRPEVAPPAERRSEVGLHRLPRHTGRSRRIGLAFFVAGLLVVAGAIWFRSPTAAPGALAGPVPPTTQPTVADRWLPVVDRLDVVRATAYERGDVAMLAQVWMSGWRLQADVAQLRALLSSGCTARGVRHRFDGVDVLAVYAQRVRLRVRQWLPASQRVRAGRVVGDFAGSPPTVVSLDLVATDAGWRLG